MTDKIPCKPIGTMKMPDGPVFILVQVPGGSTVSFDADLHEPHTQHDAEALCVYTLAVYLNICLTETAHRATEGEWW